jgi:hypothetical protein
MPHKKGIGFFSNLTAETAQKTGGVGFYMYIKYHSEDFAGNVS